MAQLKTQPTKVSAAKFFASVADETRRAECRQLLKLMKAATGKPAVMWGSSIVGFGSYHYKYASGREGDWFLTGFSPRKQAMTIYIMGGLKQFAPLLKKLGKHKVSGGSCLYIRKLTDVDLQVLARLIRDAVAAMRAQAKALVPA
jgi:hypothetical protein